MSEYLDFSSAQGIRDYINECFRVINELEEEMDEMYISFFNPKRHELKKRRKIIKKRLNGIRNNVRVAKDILENYTTFDSEIFLPFLSEYLTLKEHEKYELLLDVEEMNFGMAMATKTYPLNLYGAHYNIVTTDYNCEILEEAKDSWGSADTNDIDDFLDYLDDDKYICLEDSNYYTLLNVLSLDSDYDRYPYLYDLANELIDMKLANPDMSDEERLESILDGLKEERKSKRNKSNVLRPEFWGNE